MIDERQDNGIDEDGDWNVEKHDVGIDGVPNTGDEVRMMVCLHLEINLI